MSTTSAPASVTSTAPLAPVPAVVVPQTTLRRLYRLQTDKRRFSRDLLTVLAWASVAGALGLWVADGGLTTVNSAANLFLAAGTVAGLVHNERFSW